MNTRRRVLDLTIVASLLLAVVPAAGQELSWFAQADHVDGCSTAVGHTGWIEVSAIHHLWFKVEGVSTTPNKKEFILTRPMDCSTRQFWEALRQQTDINQLVLENVEANPPYRVMQVIRFDDVRVTSIETAGADFPGPPVERIRFSYNRVEYKSNCYDAHGSCGYHEYTHQFPQNP